VKTQTNILRSVTLFENRAGYETMWKNMVNSDRLQMTIWCKHIACWKTRVTNTHSKYVIRIVFPLQQWFHEKRINVTLYVQCLACLQLRVLQNRRQITRIFCTL